MEDKNALIDENLEQVIGGQKYEEGTDIDGKQIVPSGTKAWFGTADASIGPEGFKISSNEEE